MNWETLNCRLLFVSFCDPTNKLHKLWAREWSQAYIGESKGATLVLDPTKSAYQALSIPSSQLAAWGPANSWYYLKAILFRGKRNIEVQGEAGQLGADFCLDCDGRVLMAHYCRNPTDRIAVHRLYEAVRQQYESTQQ